MTAKQRQDVTKEVLEVIRNGNRIDRYLTAASDGTLCVTTHDVQSPQVKIPCGDCSIIEDEEAEWAANFVYQAEVELL